MSKRKPREKHEEVMAPPPRELPAFAPADPVERELQFAEERSARLRPRTAPQEDAETDSPDA